MTISKPTSDIRLLAVAATIGLLAVAYGMLEKKRHGSALPHFAVAAVNDEFIRRDYFERALQRQQGDSREPLSDDDRQWVLRRLIDEELLVQRGLSLGMARSEDEVRGAIVRSLIASVTAEADAANPHDEQLRTWFAQHSERFTTTSAMAVRAWTSADESTAQLFAQELRVAASTRPPEGIVPLPGLPDGLLPLAKLRDYLGPGISGALARLPEGLVTVYAQQGRWLIVRIEARLSGQVADFAEVRTQVLVEYRRDLADSLLRAYLDSLHENAHIVSEPAQ